MELGQSELTWLLLQVRDQVLLDGDTENGMGPGRHLVHHSLGCPSGVRPDVKAVRHLGRRPHSHLFKPTYSDHPVLLLPYLNGLLILGLAKQVNELFVIDFQETAFNDELGFVSARLLFSVDESDHPRDDAKVFFLYA